MKGTIFPTCLKEVKSHHWYVVESEASIIHGRWSSDTQAWRQMPVVPAGETREQEFKAVLCETLGRKRDGRGWENRGGKGKE